MTKGPRTDFDEMVSRAFFIYNDDSKPTARVCQHPISRESRNLVTGYATRNPIDITLLVT